MPERVAHSRWLSRGNIRGRVRRKNRYNVTVNATSKSSAIYIVPGRARERERGVLSERQIMVGDGRRWVKNARENIIRRADERREEEKH